VANTYVHVLYLVKFSLYVFFFYHYEDITGQYQICSTNAWRKCFKESKEKTLSKLYLKRKFQILTVDLILPCYPCRQKLLSDKQIKFKEFCVSWNKFHKNLPRDTYLTKIPKNNMFCSKCNSCHLRRDIALRNPFS
jgi:hypothetical protein